MWYVTLPGRAEDAYRLRSCFYRRPESRSPNRCFKQSWLRENFCRNWQWSKIRSTTVGGSVGFCSPKNSIVVWKLDRLGRSLKHLIDTVNDLHKRKIGFRCLQENLDTTTSSGKLFFHIIGALAEFERDIIRERTNAGLMAARARGRLGGRPRLLNAKKIQMAKALLGDRRNDIKDVCTTLGVSRSTLYRCANIG